MISLVSDALHGLLHQIGLLQTLVRNAVLLNLPYFGQVSRDLQLFLILEYPSVLFLILQSLHPDLLFHRPHPFLLKLNPTHHSRLHVFRLTHVALAYQMETLA